MFATPKSEFTHKATPNLTVGPVIGRTTTHSVRILLETLEATVYTLVLIDTSDGGNGTQIEREISLPRRVPVVTYIDGLEPSTPYTLEIEGEEVGRFRTLGVRARGLRAGIVSCNKPSDGVLDGSEASLWETLGDKAPELDVVFHVGDQVYADPAYQAVLDLVESGQLAPEDERWVDVVSELYRNFYRRNWSAPATRRALASVSNVFIWDDHEIRDDFGSIEGDADPESLAYKIGLVARMVYREYQAALTRQESEIYTSDLEHLMYRMGNVGIVILDQRGGRSFYKAVNGDDESADEGYLGRAQWDDLEREIVHQDGMFASDDVQHLVVATSVPLVYLNSVLTDVGAQVDSINDLKDHWAYGEHEAEQSRMIDMLLNWKYGDAHATTPYNDRTVTIVAGDVHVGLHSLIRRPNGVKGSSEQVLMQFTASAITNTPPAPPLLAILTKALQRPIPIPKDKFGVFFSHAHVMKESNIGLLSISEDGDVHTTLIGLSGAIVHSSDVLDQAFDSGACCCSLM